MIAKLPLGFTRSYVYNDLSQITLITDRLGRKREFTYDELNRLDTEVWKDALGVTVKTITFDWDANDNLLSISDGVTTYTNEFDQLNRLIEQDGVWGTTLTFGWDAANRRTSVTDNFHGVVSSVYDDVNRLTRRTLSNETGYSGINPIRVDLAYNDRDLTSITRYASLTTSNKVASSVFTFDDAQRLTALKHKNASDTIFADYGWSFDAGDRITQELLNSVAKNFTYDDTNQLLTATGEDPYAWDANGNRVATDWVTGDNNQLLEHPEFWLEYDDEGNLTAKLPTSCDDEWNYQYDHLNRMTVAAYVTHDGVTVLQVSFVYDVLGNRVEKRVQEDTDANGDFDTDTKLRTAYLNGNPWADLDGSNTLVTRYVGFDGLGAPIARQSAGGTTAWYVTNNLGSVTHIVSNAGAVINQITYDSFGGISSETNPSNGDRFKHGGMQWHGEISFYGARERFYDPETARWTTEDPTGLSPDMNAYRYTGNAPVMRIDPSGLDWRDWFLGPISAAGMYVYEGGRATYWWWNSDNRPTYRDVPKILRPGDIPNAHGDTQFMAAGQAAGMMGNMMVEVVKGGINVGGQFVPFPQIGDAVSRFGKLINKFLKNPGGFKKIRQSVKPAIGAAKGGKSIETLWQDETGADFVHHCVIDKKGNITDNHFRPFPKQ